MIDPFALRVIATAMVAGQIEGASRLELKPEAIADRAADIADACIVEVAKRTKRESVEVEDNTKVS